MNDFLENTKQAFDKIAAEYEARDNSNPIFRWMRSIVHKIYLKWLSPGSRILELNSGTGTDAIFLADKGMTIYATDISSEMINVLRSNAKSQISAGSIICDVKSFDEVDTITETNFDAVISNFGGLNCINDFSKLSKDLHSRLKPGGKFIAVVMNSFCPWEILYYLTKPDLNNAVRRFNRDGVYADLNGEKVKTFYFSPKQFSRFFNEHFKAERIYTLGYYTPPPYLVGIYDKLRPLVKLFMKIDELLMGIFPYNRIGDHFIIIMSRK